MSELKKAQHERDKQIILSRLEVAQCVSFTAFAGALATGAVEQLIEDDILGGIATGVLTLGSIAVGLRSGRDALVAAREAGIQDAQINALKEHREATSLQLRRYPRRIRDR